MQHDLPYLSHLRIQSLQRIFVTVVLRTTAAKQGAGRFAGLVIGFTLILIHIVCIPITGTSVNPARSLAPALFAGGEALIQLWAFLVTPFIGAILAAYFCRFLESGDDKAKS